MSTPGTIIVHKKSTTTGVEPDASALYQAEIAINTADAKIFTKRDDGQVLATSIGAIQSGHYELTTNNINQVIDSFPASLYRSAKYVVQSTHSTGGFQTIEILVMHDGTNVYITRYGLMYTASQLATFNVQLNGGNVELLTSPTNTDTSFKYTRTVVQA